MPADPSVDLAALDALYQAATKLRDRLELDECEFDPILRRSFTTYRLPDDGEVDALDAALAALDLLALRRRLEIGDAAVEVLEADAKLEAAAQALNKAPPSRRLAAHNARDDAERAADAACARLRALREAPDAA